MFVSLATFVGAVLHEVVEDDANEFVSFLKRGIIIVVDIFHYALELLNQSKYIDNYFKPCSCYTALPLLSTA